MFKNNIIHLVRWFCSQLTHNELLDAVTILLEVLNEQRDDIQFKQRFREEHPNYRDYQVETTPPMSAPPMPEPSSPRLDWRELISRQSLETGRAPRPVSRRNGLAPPAASSCEQCGAPAQWLYVNDGTKCSQLRCKLCAHLFPVRRVRRDSDGPFWCPHCGSAMYKWKQKDHQTIYKCPSRKCPRYLRAWEGLNRRERLLAKTGMSSQFKLHYQWRVYHFDTETVRPEAPRASSGSLLDVRRSMNSVGLALAYSVSLGLSSRTTARALREIHGINVSHQTVLNWLEAAAPMAWDRLENLNGAMSEKTVAADETYIKIMGLWYYTWFLIGVETRAIWAWNVSDNRGEIPAAATINQALDRRDSEQNEPLVLVGDGNPSYDAAVNAVNSDADGLPLPSEEHKVKRKTVTGLRNEDEQSRQFRPFKQMIERLNRTYRWHTRSRFGHKDINGATALTTLFVAYYNFLRPHGSLRGRTPVHLPELDGVATLQGKWIRLLQPAA